MHKKVSNQLKADKYIYISIKLSIRCFISVVQCTLYIDDSSTENILDQFYFYVHMFIADW